MPNLLRWFFVLLLPCEKSRESLSGMGRMEVSTPSKPFYPLDVRPQEAFKTNHKGTQ
jgi:hypothetical protein